MTLKSQGSYKEDMRKLRELISGIKIALLTTIGSDGTLQARPMATQEQEFDGVLWFFTGKDTEKIREIQKNSQVGVVYSSPESSRYVSVSGTAELIEDRSKIEELWNPSYKAWFPDGLDDPNLVLLKIEAVRAEYWDTPTRSAAGLFSFVQALATGDRAEKVGENEEILLKHIPSISTGTAGR
jgi:general stress protein 26